MLGQTIGLYHYSLQITFVRVQTAYYLGYKMLMDLRNSTRETSSARIYPINAVSPVTKMQTFLFFVTGQAIVNTINQQYLVVYISVKCQYYSI